MHNEHLAVVLHHVDEVVLYPFVLTVVNTATSILRKPKKKTKWSHRKDLTLVGVNMNCTEQTTLVQGMNERINTQFIVHQYPNT